METHFFFTRSLLGIGCNAAPAFLLLFFYLLQPKNRGLAICCVG
jgi:hypothetical protein